MAKLSKRRQAIANKVEANFEDKIQLLGYEVDHRTLVACDYGAPTSRKRLFIIARCDGQPIVWPEPTHGSPAQIAKELKVNRVTRRKPWRTAADIIDWSIPCPSIFLSPEEAKEQGCKRPLAEKTLARIALPCSRAR